MPMRVLMTCLLALQVAGAARSQLSGPPQPTPAAPVPAPATQTRGVWRTFGVRDGFPNGSVRAIQQDRDLSIWFATTGRGVARFDGATFRTFDHSNGLAHNRVNTIMLDQHGMLWFGTLGGLSRFDGRAFKTFTTDDGLAANSVYSIAEDADGGLWFGTEAGISRYDGSDFLSFTSNDGLAAGRVISIFVEDHQSIWFATKRNGVSRFDGQAFHTYTTKDGLPDNQVWAMARDASGDLWFGTDEGLSCLHETRFTDLEALNGLEVTDLVVDKSGILWIATDGSGIFRYDGMQTTNLTTANGLIDNDVWSIEIDHHGALWFGTDGGGVSRYSEQELTAFTFETGLMSNEIRAIIPGPQGDLWIGSTQDLTRYDGATFAPVYPKLPRQLLVARALLIDHQGALWFSSTTGICRYDGEHIVDFRTDDSFPKGDIHTIAEDRVGNLWFGTDSQGVVRYDGQEFVTLTTADGLANNEVRASFVDRDGAVWFGTWGGVSRYDGGEFTNFSVRDGLAFDQIWAIAADNDGNLWFGTDGWGVSRYDGEKFESFTTVNGLANDKVRAITVAHDGKVWFGTEGGLSCFDGFAFQSLYRNDGLPANGIYALHAREDGGLWLGTFGGGLVEFRPDSSPPPITVTDVITDRRHGAKRKISFPSTRSHLRIEFRGVSFKTGRDALLYRYRLLGFQDEWQTTHFRQVEYDHLPRGEFRFEVQAIDRELDYSPKPASIQVTSHLPWIQMAMWAALTLAVVVVCWQARRLVHRNRSLIAAQVEILRHQEELVRKERLAALGELTATVSHELRNPLGTIRTSHFTIDNRSRGKGLSVENALDRLKRNVDRCDRIIDELLSYTRAVELDLETIYIDSWLDVLLNEITIPDGVALIRKLKSEAVTSVDSELLRRAVINVVENACQAMVGDETSTAADSLEVETRSNNESVEIRFTDTGPGIPPDSADRIFEPLYSTRNFGVGLGLAIVSRILEQHGGSVDVINGVQNGGQNGVTVILSLPVTQSG